MVLHAARALLAQIVETQTILLRLDFLEKVLPQARQLQLADRTLEQGKLHALAEIEADLGHALQTPPPFLCRGGCHIVGDQNEHGLFSTFPQIMVRLEG
jgi:hypothetical protein